MYFFLSKTLGFFAIPSNLLIALGLLGLLLLCVRFRRLGSWLIVTSVVLIAVAGYSPLGNVLMLPLEQRFPPWRQSSGIPDGIVVLGGAIDPDISRARGTPVLNDAADRITAAAELARMYPNARIIFSGGSASLMSNAPPEAPYAVKELEALGVDHSRITAEEQSRNTIENAVFSRLLAQPKPGEHWLLVTSAFHMPRAMAAFRAVDFPVTAYPVNWRTRGRHDAIRPFGSLREGLTMTDYAVHEWIGLLVYRLAGKTTELFPKP